MTTARSLVFMMAAGLLIGTPAQAQVALLFDNGPMDYLNGGELTLYTEAEDFELSFSAVATRIDFGNGGHNCTFPANWDGVLRWWIMEDDGGMPGSTFVATGIAPSVSVFLDLDQCPGAWAWYDLTFSLGQQVQLEGGVRYWLALHMAGDWSWRRELYWATSSSGLYSTAMVQLEGVGRWTATGRHQSFMILAYGDDHDIFVDEFESGDYDIWSWFT